jgi:hypothetical protein
VRRRRAIEIAALAAAAVIGSVATIAVWGGKSTSGQSAPRPTATAQIVRTNLTTSTLTEGTLGYAPINPVVNLIGGTYTAVPTPGSTIQPGQPLYRVDNQPIVLMSGSTPAWRTFAPGMTNGPDVTELEANLIALGYAHGLFSAASDRFSLLTAEAISRWQIANGYLSSGQVPLGEVVFESGPVLVGAANHDYSHCVSRTERKCPTGQRRGVSVNRAPNGRHDARPGVRRRARTSWQLWIRFFKQ